MSEVGLVYGPGLLGHIPSFPHPSLESFEGPDRVAYTMASLRRSGILDDPQLVVLPPRPADEQELLRVHDPYLVDLVRFMSKLGGGVVGMSSYATRDTFETAKLSAGAAIIAGEAVMKGDLQQVFALTRPPGHHAGRARADGLCFFNNVAVMIEHLRERFSLKRILVVDWDVHFGDGISEIYYTDPSVLYISLHEYDYELNEKGTILELGSGSGKYYNVNLPLPLGLTPEQYIYAFEEVIPPLADEYSPELIVVSAGMDGHFADPIGNMRIKASTYAYLTEQILKSAKKSCSGRAVFVLEGGYSLLGLPLSVVAVLSTLLQTEIQYFDDFPMRPSDDSMETVKEIVKELKETLASHWSTL